MVKVLAIGPALHNSGQAHAFHLYSDEIDAHICTYRTNSLLIRILSLAEIALKLFFTRKEEFDAIYVCFSRSRSGILRDCWICILVEIYFKNVVLVNHVHGSDIEKFYISIKGTLYQTIFNYIYRRVNLNLVLSHSIDTGILPKFFKTECMPNYIPLNRYKCRKRKANSSTRRILFFSNLCETKGINTFLRLCHKSENISSLHFTIAGKIIQDGETDIKGLSQKLMNLPINTEYVGVVDKQKVPEFLKEFDILIFPSYYKSEAFPIAILEALASGLVVLANDVGFIKEWFPDYCRFVLFNEENDDKLIECLSTVPLDTHYILDKFEIKNFRGQFIDAISKI